MNKEVIESGLALVQTVASNKNVQKAVLGTYSNGKTRSVVDAISKEYLSPKEKAKYKKILSENQKKRALKESRSNTQLSWRFTPTPEESAEEMDAYFKLLAKYQSMSKKERKKFEKKAKKKAAEENFKKSKKKAKKKAKKKDRKKGCKGKKNPDYVSSWVQRMESITLD